jgi:hypothetical protein
MLTAQNGHYLAPPARILLAIAYRREHHSLKAPAGVCGSRSQTTSLQLRPLHLPCFLSNQARSPGLRPSRHDPPLAARTVSQVLGSAVEGEPAPSLATRDGRRDSTPDREDGCHQPSLARTQDSRRVEDAPHRDFRTHCLPNPTETAAAATARPGRRPCAITSVRRFRLTHYKRAPFLR